MGTLSVDPKHTEQFLLNQEDVLDASVWFDGGELSAHVTLAPGATFDEIDLKHACETQLGYQQTPNQFVLVSARH
jgi:hypothetical protein